MNKPGVQQAEQAICSTSSSPGAEVLERAFGYKVSGSFTVEGQVARAVIDQAVNPGAPGSLRQVLVNLQTEARAKADGGLFGFRF